MTVICPVCGKNNDSNVEYCRFCDATIHVAKNFGIGDADLAEGNYEESVVSKEIDTNALDKIEGSIRENIDETARNIEEAISNEKSDKKDLVEEKRRLKRASIEDRLKNRSKHYEHIEDDQSENGGLIKISYVICPYCGSLNTQNQFFCQNCGSDLKHSKSVKVPAGRYEEIQRKYAKSVLKYLVKPSDNDDIQTEFKKFQSLSGDKRVETANWKLGKEMTMESSGFNLDKATLMGVAIGYFVLKSIFKDLDLFWLIAVYGGYKAYRKYILGEDGKSIVLTDLAVEVWDTDGKKNKKVREIKWSAVDEIAIVGKGKKMRLNLHSSDKSTSCKLPVFTGKKRAMMLNVFGIIANRKNLKVYYDLNLKEETE